MTDSNQRSPFAWPGRALLGRSLGWIAAIGAVWTVCYHGADQLNGLHDWRVPVHFAFELAMPFWPAMTLVYSSVYLMFLAGPFVLREPDSIDRLACAALAETLLASSVFVLLPSETAYPAIDVGGLGPWTAPFLLADQINGGTNCVPSLHVAFAATCGWALYRGSGGVLFLGWAAAIGISTLVTHQHHLLDVATGVLLAAFGLRVAPRLLGWLQKVHRSGSGRASTPAVPQRPALARRRS